MEGPGVRVVREVLHIRDILWDHLALAIHIVHQNQEVLELTVVWEPEMGEAVEVAEDTEAEGGRHSRKICIPFYKRSCNTSCSMT